MIKELMYTKTLKLIAFGILFFFKAYSQTIKFDTLKNTDRRYEKYIAQSKEILSLIKKNEDKVISKYFENPGIYNKKNLKYNLVWVRKLLQKNNGVLESVVLEKSKISFSNYIYDPLTLNITYSLGHSDCTKPSYNNTITISFSDVAKGEGKFEFTFDNCQESEKLRRTLLNIKP